jgi:hypothetical protein
MHMMHGDFLHQPHIVEIATLEQIVLDVIEGGQIQGIELWVEPGASPIETSRAEHELVAQIHTNLTRLLADVQEKHLVGNGDKLVDP